MNLMKPLDQQITPLDIKSHICYITELAALARYHKIDPVYEFAQINGEQRNKRFAMTLTLGNEKWSALGENKKEVRQEVAKIALEKTVLTKPPPSLPKKKPCVNADALTPTVQLNSLAMAHGKQVVYTVTKKEYDPSIPSPNYNPHHQQRYANISSFAPIQFINFDQHHLGDSHTHYPYVNPTNYYGKPAPLCQAVPKRPNRFEVTLTIDDKKYIGVGRTLQGARHDAASNAISFFDNIPVKGKIVKGIDETKTNETAVNDACNGSDFHQPGKSPVSVLYEEALPRNMSVVFNVRSTNGPDHLRTYTMDVTVGYFNDGVLNEQFRHYEAEGSGANKKIAKRNAAQNVLEKMKYLPRRVKRTQKPQTTVTKSSPNISESLHPVSRLLQIAQAKRVKEPEFVAGKEELSNAFQQVFVYHCTFEGASVEGKGKTKKEAKRVAAEKMLSCVGCKVSCSQVPNLDMVPQKTSLKSSSGTINNSGKRLQVKFDDNNPRESIIKQSGNVSIN